MLITITEKFKNKIFVLYDGKVYCCEKHENFIPTYTQTTAFNGRDIIDLKNTESYELGDTLNCYFVGEVDKNNKIKILIYFLSSAEILLEEISENELPVYALVPNVSSLEDIGDLKTGEKVYSQQITKKIKEKALEVMLFLKKEFKI